MDLASIGVNLEYGVHHVSDVNRVDPIPAQNVTTLGFPQFILVEDFFGLEEHGRVCS